MSYLELSVGKQGEVRAVTEAARTWLMEMEGESVSSIIEKWNLKSENGKILPAKQSAASSIANDKRHSGEKLAVEYTLPEVSELSLEQIIGVFYIRGRPPIENNISRIPSADYSPDPDYVHYSLRAAMAIKVGEVDGQPKYVLVDGATRLTTLCAAAATHHLSSLDTLGDAKTWFKTSCGPLKARIIALKPSIPDEACEIIGRTFNVSAESGVPAEAHDQLKQLCKVLPVKPPTNCSGPLKSRLEKEVAGFKDFDDTKRPAMYRIACAINSLGQKEMDSVFSQVQSLPFAPTVKFWSQLGRVAAASPYAMYFAISSLAAGDWMEAGRTEIKNEEFGRLLASCPLFEKAQQEDAAALEWLLNAKRPALDEGKLTLATLLEPLVQSPADDKVLAAQFELLSKNLAQSRKRKMPDFLANCFTGASFEVGEYKIQAGSSAMKKASFGLKPGEQNVPVYKLTLGVGTSQERDAALVEIPWTTFASYLAAPPSPIVDEE